MNQLTIFDSIVFVRLKGTHCSTNDIRLHDEVVGLVWGKKFCISCVRILAVFNQELQDYLDETYGRKVWSAWNGSGSTAEVGRASEPRYPGKKENHVRDRVVPVGEPRGETQEIPLWG